MDQPSKYNITPRFTHMQPLSSQHPHHLHVYLSIICCHRAIRDPTLTDRVCVCMCLCINQCALKSYCVYKPHRPILFRKCELLYKLWQNTSLYIYSELAPPSVLYWGCRKIPWSEKKDQSHM